MGQHPAECNLPVSEYLISYSGDFGNSSTFTVDATDCPQSWCNHVFENIDVSVPLYTVSISAVSELGAGRPAMSNYVSKSKVTVIICMTIDGGNQNTSIRIAIKLHLRKSRIISRLKEFMLLEY